MSSSIFINWFSRLCPFRACIAAFVLVLIPHVANAVTGHSDFDSPETGLHAHPYLGVGESFGRWENGVVPIGYNHAGARTGVSAAEMIQNIEIAFEIIEHVADIKFEFVGETGSNMYDFADIVVVMGWEYSEDQYAARAGPRGAFQSETHRRLGYSPYTDGRVTFNSASSSSYSVALIIHELLHLLGFGHSENPVSIMTPYAFLFATLQPDDIAGLQAVYGPPDVFISPDNAVELSAGPVSGVRVTDSETGFYIRPASSSSNADLRPLSVLDSSYSPDDWIIFTVRYSGMMVGTQITDYVTLPSGYQLSGSPFTVGYSSGYVSFFIGYAKNLLYFPGVWQTDLAVAGSRLAQGKLQVNGTAAQFNRTPAAALRVNHEDDEFFRMHLQIADQEGDYTVTDWMFPNAGTAYYGSSEPLLRKGAIGIEAAQIFGQVRDTVDRNPPNVQSGSKYGPGFASVVSRWIANPAEPNTPTFYVDTDILHIPSLDLEGTLVTANFKRTALEGIVLKFLEFDPLLNFTGTPMAQYRDGSGTLTLSKLVVYDQGQKSHFNNAVFRIIPGSSPLKMELISVNQ